MSFFDIGPYSFLILVERWPDVPLKRDELSWCLPVRRGLLSEPKLAPASGLIFPAFSLSLNALNWKRFQSPAQPLLNVEITSFNVLLAVTGIILNHEKALPTVKPNWHPAVGPYPALEAKQQPISAPDYLMVSPPETRGAARDWTRAACTSSVCSNTELSLQHDSLSSLP